jgi:hypothetical protein
MDSPFTKATETRRRLKVLIYGPPKVGKTLMALGLPKPVVIDLEHGTDAYADRREFDVLHTISTAEVKAAVEWLGANRGQYETVIVDPITVWWEALQSTRYELGERKAMAAKRPSDNIDLAFADWNKIKLAWNTACARIVNSGYHFVAIARQADEYAGEGLNLKKVGVKPAGDKGAPYWFDTIVRIEFRGDDRMVIVEGDRWDIMQGQRVMSLDEFAPALYAYAIGTMDVPEVTEPDPEGSLRNDVEQEEKTEATPAPAAQPKPSNGTKGQVPCPRGCGGFIVEKTAKSGKTFYGCSAFQAKQCKATMSPGEFSEAVAGVAKAATEAPKPVEEQPAYMGSAVAWRQYWREKVVTLGLREDAVREDLQALWPGDLDEIPVKYRQTALIRMEEMAGVTTQADPFKDQ